MAIQAHLCSENFGFAFGASNQDLLMDNWGFVPQQDHQQLLQFQNSSHHQKIPDFENVNDRHQSMAFSQCVAAHIEKQRLEFEHFIYLQNERLRLAMQEKRKHQISQMVKKYESRAEILLKQKEEEIARATSRAMELQEYLRRMEMESQTWQRVAKENEAMAASLNTTIERLRESANAAEDAESYCCENTAQTPLICRWCNSGKSCVVMLPCRHLCCCKVCEVFLDSCPVCRMVKKSTIEALI